MCTKKHLPAQVFPLQESWETFGGSRWKILLCPDNIKKIIGEVNIMQLLQSSYFSDEVLWAHLWVFRQIIVTAWQIIVRRLLLLKHNINWFSVIMWSSATGLNYIININEESCFFNFSTSSVWAASVGFGDFLNIPLNIPPFSWNRQKQTLSYRGFILVKVGSLRDLLARESASLCVQCDER